MCFPSGRIGKFRLLLNDGPCVVKGLRKGRMAGCESGAAPDESQSEDRPGKMDQLRAGGGVVERALLGNE